MRRTSDVTGTFVVNIVGNAQQRLLLLSQCQTGIPLLCHGQSRFPGTFFVGILSASVQTGLMIAHQIDAVLCREQQDRDENAHQHCDVAAMFVFQDFLENFQIEFCNFFGKKSTDFGGKILKSQRIAPPPPDIITGKLLPPLPLPKFSPLISKISSSPGFKTKILYFRLMNAFFAHSCS
jgi:hypothetical protein